MDIQINKDRKKESQVIKWHKIKQRMRHRDKTVRRMILFPLILIVCWTFGSVQRIIDILGIDIQKMITFADLLRISVDGVSL